MARVAFDVCGQTVGVLGTGRIGRLVAPIVRDFGAQVIACDPAPLPDWSGRHEVLYLELDSALAQSDILTLHLPLTPATCPLWGERTLARIKPGPFVINTGRGKQIDTTALLQHLKSGHHSAAGGCVSSDDRSAAGFLPRDRPVGGNRRGRPGAGSEGAGAGGVEGSPGGSALNHPRCRGRDDLPVSASPSDIAAPAATRMSSPETNPTLHLTSSLAITFPFNITLGIPIRLEVARHLYA